ncbi:hypothetical protein FHS21_006230 [Phyllobacterium trifolii]|uniref:Lipoprotein n=1 Tax=Phyllobacterium trifolii TaxID=300193 RepID=A0A839UFI1_9HYPH|nr:hypothetical protein [Phyllobacterium trifolii]MBB3149776.1 hypothetical protein [Phyllobacterium trifolii]
MKIRLIAASICTLVSGCAHDQASTNPFGNFAGSTSSVAVQALGSSAYSVDPRYGYQISTPGIYKFDASGQPFEICEKDVRLQTAIKNMTTEPINSSDILEDDLASANFEISVPGIGSIKSPYRKIKVEGYTVTKLISGDSGDAADYILRNVDSGCRDTILQRNKPYMIVTKVATAKTAYALSRGAFEANFAAGPARIGWANPEIRSTPRTNVTFAISGKYAKR